METVYQLVSFQTYVLEPTFWCLTSKLALDLIWAWHSMLVCPQSFKAARPAEFANPGHARKAFGIREAP